MSFFPSPSYSRYLHTFLDIELPSKEMRRGEASWLVMMHGGRDIGRRWEE